MRWRHKRGKEQSGDGGTRGKGTNSREFEEINRDTERIPRVEPSCDSGKSNVMHSTDKDIGDLLVGEPVNAARSSLFKRVRPKSKLKYYRTNGCNQT